MTPTKEGQPTSEKVSIGEYYWGYASGVAATKVPSVGEFVLAELTQTFDYGDLTYFLPLMAQVGGAWAADLALARPMPPLMLSTSTTTFTLMTTMALPLCRFVTQSNSAFLMKLAYHFVPPV